MNKEIYILTFEKEVDYGSYDTMILGVFSSRELAREVKEKYEAQVKIGRYDSFGISIIGLDRQPSAAFLVGINKTNITEATQGFGVSGLSCISKNYVEYVVEADNKEQALQQAKEIQIKINELNLWGSEDLVHHFPVGEMAIGDS